MFNVSFAENPNLLFASRCNSVKSYNNGDIIDVVVEKEPCTQKSAVDVNEDFSADEIAEVIGDNSAKTPF